MGFDWEGVNSAVHSGMSLTAASKQKLRNKHLNTQKAQNTHPVESSGVKLGSKDKNMQNLFSAVENILTYCIYMCITQKK